MGIIGGHLGYKLLRFIAPRTNSALNDTCQAESSANLELAFGKDIFDLIYGKTVIDFGCGVGSQTVEMARRGAANVIGIDIQEHFLECGRRSARQHGVEDRCVFTTATKEVADIVISKDAFEHFSDPGAMLNIIASLLKPGGYVLASFGPTWLHPYGGHLFSIFPWAHLVFSEAALIRWRSDFRTDGATRFSEVAGGLNQLTISRFEQIVAKSPLRFEWLESVPIRGIPILRSRLLREIGTSIVRCKLILR